MANKQEGNQHTQTNNSDGVSKTSKKSPKNVEKKESVVTEEKTKNIPKDSTGSFKQKTQIQNSTKKPSNKNIQEGNGLQNNKNADRKKSERKNIKVATNELNKTEVDVVDAKSVELETENALMPTEIKQKRKRTKFTDLSKTNKVLTIINLSLNGLLSALCVALMIIYGLKGDPDHRMLSCVFMFVLSLIPLCAELIFKFRLNPTVYLFYIVYLFVAGLWGSCLNGYNKVWWLDIAIHFFFGYVGGLIGLFYLCKTKENLKLKLFTIVLICFAVSMACGAVWEIFEFIGDRFFGQTAQGFPNNGITPVNDTMEDIVCNFGGAVLFCIHYALYKLTHKNLGMGYIEKDFSTKI